jgi:ATP-binding cassette subfamily B protein
MTSYDDDDELQRGRLSTALWCRMLVHAHPYRRSFAGLAFAGLVIAACDIVIPRITGAVIDSAIAARTDHLAFYGASYMGLVVLMMAMVAFFIIMAGVASTGVAHDLRRAGFKRLQELSFSFYDHRPVGWLMARLTSDCDRISSVLPWTLLDFVWGSFLLTGVICMMFWMNWKLALVVLSIVPPLAVATAVYQKRMMDSQRLARKANSKITAAFNEGIAGVRTTKAFVREEQNLREFTALTGVMFDHSLRNSLQASVYLPIVMSLGAMGVGLAVWQGGLLAWTGAIPVGDLFVFMQYAAFFHAPIQEMAQRFTGLQAAQASAERLQALLDTPPAIRDIAGARGEIGHIREITFENVGFSYKEGGPVLRDFSLRIGAGQSIALVGETGSGKSTIAKLLCRFYEPTEGRILIDGIDYREIRLHALQSCLGMVLQEPHLFSGTIRENIRYGKLAASTEEIESVARQVGAAPFIEALPDGYESEVGEGGNRLSTGQKQLVTLARALLADPQILVLDEATSSVDTETERQIQAGIEAMLKGRISVIIAHRLSTIRSADRILVIDHGRLLEEGNNTELLAQRGVYSRLYAQQFHAGV